MTAGAIDTSYSLRAKIELLLQEDGYGKRIAKWWDEHPDFTSDKLAEEIDVIAEEYKVLIRALLADNERMVGALMSIGKTAFDVMQDDVAPYGALLNAGWVAETASDALQAHRKLMGGEG